MRQQWFVDECVISGNVGAGVKLARIRDRIKGALSGKKLGLPIKKLLLGQPLNQGGWKYRT